MRSRQHGMCRLLVSIHNTGLIIEGGSHGIAMAVWVPIWLRVGTPMGDSKQGIR